MCSYKRKNLPLYYISSFDKSELWVSFIEKTLAKLKHYKDYLICAGIKMEFSLVKWLFRNGLEQRHEYTLIEIIEIKKKKK